MKSGCTKHATRTHAPSTHASVASRRASERIEEVDGIEGTLPNRTWRDAATTRSRAVQLSGATMCTASNTTAASAGDSCQLFATAYFTTMLSEPSNVWA